MSFELLFKVFLTVVVLFFSVVSLKWIWRSQIDIKETGRKLLETPQKSMDWVVTRDPAKIYQDGKEVGDITGKIETKSNVIIFYQICNTSGLNESLPFEYKKEKLKVIRCGGRYDIKGGSPVRTNVLEGVECEKLQ